MMTRPPEVLAPAGSYDIMVRAFQAGADAVYLGGQMYGARAYASNLSDQELLQAIEYAAFHHKRVYLTVNTLLKDEDIDRLSAYLKAPYEMGLDGVIVQDLGAVALIRSRFPDMEVHASTQMTITSPAAALRLKEFGVTRIVPARELSMEEIVRIKEESGLEVEIFVHGALCYCYSGQCLLSSMIGGRSGNRGTCAQPCRQLYHYAPVSSAAAPKAELSVSERKTGTSVSAAAQDFRYYLSPKDLCGLKAVPELIRAGVDSLKIEGRMKNAEYVISATAAYRKAVDAYVNSEEFHVEAERDRLADIYNRGDFTEGYYHQQHGSSMMCMDRNHHNGLYMGRLGRVTGGTLELILQQQLDPGDILEIRLGRNQTVELTSGVGGEAGETVRLHGKQMRRLSPGLSVYRTKHPALCKQLMDHNDHSQLKEKIHISVICKKDLPVTITMSCEDQQVQVTGAVVQRAERQPVTREDLQEKIYKIGDYPYEIASIQWELEPDIFLSMKEWNQLRRRAMEELYQLCSRQRRRPDIRDQSEGSDIRENAVVRNQRAGVQVKADGNALSVYISRPEQLTPVLNCCAVSSIGLETEYLSAAQIRNMISMIREYEAETNREISVMLALPHIYRMNMQKELEQILALSPDGYLVRTLDELCILDDWQQREHQRVQIVLDSSVYAYNREAVRYYMEHYQIHGMTLPVEYEKNDLVKLLTHTDGCAWQWVIYGRQMVMVTAQCTYLNAEGCRRVDSGAADAKEGSGMLVNQHQDEFVVEPICKYCYNVIYQKTPVCLFTERSQLIRNYSCGVRMHFWKEQPEEIRSLLAYQTPENYTFGRYWKGI